MPKKQLKTGILGLSEKGRVLLEAANKNEHFIIEAVADQDGELVENLAETYNCSGYNDYRQFVIQNQLDCLLVAADLYSCQEYIKTAIKKKFHILKLPPLARNFAEAAEFVSLAEKENVNFAVANHNRCLKSCLALKKFMQQNSREQFFLITAQKHAKQNESNLWQTDPQIAGGGVLLYDCYQLIDQIILNFQMPECIFLLSTNQAMDKKQRLYKTEDIAVLTMKFSDTLSANLVADRIFGPDGEIIKIYGKNLNITVQKDIFLVQDYSNQTIQQSQFCEDEPSLTADILENFALSILIPEKIKLISSAKENLQNIALIESAYLSGRTAMPEEPKKILKIATFTPY
jgi:predicted dehydrogenase